MANNVIPNSFQHPNAYVDMAMELLTGEEFKCLSFATRHIFGWQDKISGRKRRMSLTMFEKGFTTDDGTRYAGTGLSRGAIIKAVAGLVNYGFLGEGDITADGTEYEILPEPKWDELRNRQAEKKELNRKRTANGRGGQSDRPVVSATDQWSVAQTDGGQSDRLNQTQVQTQEKDSATQKRVAVAHPKPEPKPRKKNAREDHFRALAECFKLDPDSLMKNKTAARIYWNAATDVFNSGVTVEQVYALHRYVKARATRSKWTDFTVMSLGKYAPDFLRDQASEAAGVSSKFVPLEEAMRRARAGDDDDA